MKKKAVVICPGRGTYNASELGYFSKYHAEKLDFIKPLEAYRTQASQPALMELDRAESYQSSLHSAGDNASALIYACAMADFHAIDQTRFDIVAVTGNSMGWYLALVAGGALTLENGMHVVNTMGTTMHKEAVGGQIVYPLVDENWIASERQMSDVKDALRVINDKYPNQAFVSINLGGMVVLAASKEALKPLLNALPPVQDRYPFIIPNHGAFHTPLLNAISDKALNSLGRELFEQPKIPMIDGRGQIWQPLSSNLAALHQYTFGRQINETYNFSKAIEVSLKEFAPDCVIILGPGTTLGAPVAQQLIAQNWLGHKSKADFIARQAKHPYIIGMGYPDQRSIVEVARASQ